MKKLLNPMLLLVLVHSVFATEYFQFGNFIACNDYICWTGYDKKIDRKNLFVGDDGWYHFNDRLIIFQPDGRERFTQATLFNYKYSATDQNKLNYRTKESCWDEFETRYVPDVSFSASSVLSEDINGKQILYTPDNLSCYMKKIPDDACYSCDELDELGTWDYSHRPWCEGAEGYGIGEKLTAKFSEPVYSFVILNGYVDPLHPDYYGKNSRVKTIKVHDRENNKSYVFNLKDLVVEQQFDLDAPANVLEFEIVDVYKGSKYSDTCVTGLYGKSCPSFVSRSDGDYDTVSYSIADLVQEDLKTKFEDRSILIDGKVDSVSVKDKISTEFCTDYFVRYSDREILYNEIIGCCKKNRYGGSELVELYNGGDLKINLTYRDDISYKTNKTVKSIEYSITSSVPLFNDSDVITDPKEYRIMFKGFYDGYSCFYHFMTGMKLKFNFADGTSFTYTASEDDMKKLLKYFDISAKIQYEH